MALNAEDAISPTFRPSPHVTTPGARWPHDRLTIAVVLTHIAKRICTALRKADIRPAESSTFLTLESRLLAICGDPGHSSMQPSCHFHCTFASAPPPANHETLSLIVPAIYNGNCISIVSRPRAALPSLFVPPNLNTLHARVAPLRPSVGCTP